ncbi:DUF3263 domain-containing protein [Micromonospora phytophila]|uniref:DUF3263 domain-containing protein n=1 Tax=Micromonospora phytophila TaxID=709888 RepID=UPI00202EC830|nr:DUF3263 domain-containing protein [Micromonospora phytophila]MCM0676297.1 DUF3263 domain-containing protein [Micromonospora phytophila]
MQPADAAPAATEPPAADRAADEPTTGGTREASSGAVVPQPRTDPGAELRTDPGAEPGTDPGELRTVPQPRSGTEPDPAGAAASPGEVGDVDLVGAGETDPGGITGLTERERAILAFEQQWWRHAGAKEQAVRDRFGLSATRYYQLLNALLDNPAALAAEPVLVGRLRRLRSSRARNRRR